MGYFTENLIFIWRLTGFAVRSVQTDSMSTTRSRLKLGKSTIRMGHSTMHLPTTALRLRWSLALGLYAIFAAFCGGCDIGDAALKPVVTEQGAQTSTEGSAATGLPRDPNEKTLIELVKCEAIAQSISRYKLAVTYKFVSGSPRPALQYAIDVSFPGCPFREMKRLQGTELQTEGTIEWLYELPGIGERGDSEAVEARFQFSEEFERQAGRVEYLGVSKPQTVKVDLSRIGL